MMSYLDGDKYVVKAGTIQPMGESVAFTGWDFADIPGNFNKNAAAAALIYFGNKIGLKLVNMENDE